MSLYATNDLSRSVAIKYPTLSMFPIILLAACSSGSSNKPPDDGATTGETTGETTSTTTGETGQVTARQINVSNAESILAHVISVVNEEPLEEFMQVWHSNFAGKGNYVIFSGESISSVDYGALDEPITLNYINRDIEVTNTATTYRDYACTSGGSGRLVSTPNVVSMMTLNDCVSTSFTFSGQVLQIASFHRPFVARGRYDNLSYVDAQQRRKTLSGRFQDGGNQVFVGERYTPAWIGVEFSSIQNSDPFTLTRFNLARDETLLGASISQAADRFFSASLKAGFGVTANWTNQSELSVAVDLNFYTRGLTLEESKTISQTSTWEDGSIVVAAHDGSFLKIELDSLNDSDLFLTLENGESIGPITFTDKFDIELSDNW